MLGERPNVSLPLGGASRTILLASLNWGLQTGLEGAPSLMPFKGGVFKSNEEENLKIVFNVSGALRVFFGSLWVLQGINVLPGSFMSGQMRWEVHGGIPVVAGIALLIWANWKRQGA